MTFKPEIWCHNTRSIQRRFGLIEFERIEESQLCEWPYILFFSIFPEKASAYEVPKYMTEENVERLFSSLTEKRAQALKLRLKDRLTLSEAGEIMGTNKEAVRQKVRKALNDLARSKEILYCLYSPEYMKLLESLPTKEDGEQEVQKILASGRMDSMTIYDVSVNVLDIRPKQKIKLLQSNIQSVGQLADKVITDKSFEEFEDILKRPLFEGKYSSFSKNLGVIRDTDKTDSEYERVDKLIELFSIGYLDNFDYVSEILRGQMGIITLQDLINSSLEDIARVKGIGEKSIQKLKECMTKLNLSFRSQIHEETTTNEFT